MQVSLRSIHGICNAKGNCVNNKRSHYPNTSNAIHNDIFVRSNSRNQVQKNTISFGFEPWKLNPYVDDIDVVDSVIKYYDMLKLGNYLDIDGDPNNPDNLSIRRINLSFLDAIEDPYDKYEFVKHYYTVTGFPDFKEVSSRIRSTFVNAVNTAESKSKTNLPTKLNSACDVLVAGYDGISSVARNKAFPGSDLDKAFVILRGSSLPPGPEGDIEDELIINEFKKHLWQSTDQRILSYNHDVDSFPEIYTSRQVKFLMDAMEHAVRSPKGLNIHGEVPSRYRTPLYDFSTDYVKANPFLIDLCRQFPCRGNWDINTSSVSRENVFEFAHTLEAMAKGDLLIKKWELPNFDTPACALMNVSQIGVLKRSNVAKDKYVSRDQLEKSYEYWTIVKKYNFIRAMIHASCSDKSWLFADYFKSSEVDRFNSLLDELGLE